MSFKRTKVVMLPTNEKAGKISIGERSGIMESHMFSFKKKGIYNNHTFFNIYFLSDEEIKEGDWWIDLLEKRIFKVTEEDVIVAKADGLPHNEFKKIIVTTDTSLLFRGTKSKHWLYLPQPSEGFIQKFVDSYNSGNPITEVEVEYGSSINFGMGKPECYHQVIKVNTKDNTITIKKPRDSWTRDEVVNLLQQFNNDKPGEFDCSKWIEENI